MPQVTVKSGDTLSQIALDYGVSVSDISGYSSGNPNLIFPGEVLNISGGGNSNISAGDVQSFPSLNLPSTDFSTDTGSVSSQVDTYRGIVDSFLDTQLTDIDAELERLRGIEEDTLGEIGDLTTPFREELLATERERLYVNENFEANQVLINELDQLLTEGNALIEQQRNVTGLAAVRNPRIQKTMDDVAGRTGVIEAVINARNGQIAVAEGLIDRSINAIAADRNDRLAYYETILNLNSANILSLDKKAERLVNEQLNLLKRDLSRAEETADYIKKLMIDPSTAGLMGEAGVSLNDSVETINTKLAQAEYVREIREFSNDIAIDGGIAVMDPSGVPESQLVTFTDSRGIKHYYKVPVGSKSSSGGFTSLEARKLEQAGLTDSSRQEQLDFLYGDGDGEVPSFDIFLDEFMTTDEASLIISAAEKERNQTLSLEARRKIVADAIRSSYDDLAAQGVELAKDFYTNTQISIGSHNAGMTISEFGKLSVDEARNFVLEG